MAEHLAILSPEEVHQLYQRPAFDWEQRARYFSFTPTEAQRVEQFATPVSKLYFLLQLGYFKAKRQFFVFDLAEAGEDVAYLHERYFAQHVILPTGLVSKPTRLRQQRVILDLYGYRRADAAARKQLLGKAAALARRHSSPLFILRDLINFLEQSRIVVPAYTTLQRLIEHATSQERARLEALITRHLGDEQKQQLDHLLEDRSRGVYLLTWLQQEAPNFKTGAMREEIARKRVLQPLYPLAQYVTAQLEIAPENVRYYGALALHYTIYKLKQIQGNLRYVLLLCFIYSRFREINDVLVEAFRYYVRYYEDEAEKAAKASLAHHQIQIHEHLGKVPAILALFVDEHIDEQTPFGQIKARVLSLIDAEKIHLLRGFLQRNRVDKEELRWQYHQENQRRISCNLRLLFKDLDFESGAASRRLLTAVQAVQRIFVSGKGLNQMPDLPEAFIAQHTRKYIFRDDAPVAARYEMLLYQTLRNRVEAGDLFVADSFQYKSFDQDLIPLADWRAHKQALLQNMGLPKLLQPIEALLAQWEERIEGLYEQVNQALRQGTNKAVALKGKRSDGSPRWHLRYEADEEACNHTIYSRFPPVGIVSLLYWVDARTDFLRAFTHVLERRARQSPEKRALVACVIAFGTNHGLGDIAKRSDLSYSDLAGTSHNFIRQETLLEANKQIVEATAELPMFAHYHLEPDRLHSSSDGQKYGTQFETINARYSPKYFGLSKGVTAYTLVANHIPVQAKVIGANEHESHYVFDLLFNNRTALHPQIHSTDTHGTNQVNFALLDLFGYQFAPRYKSITSKAKVIYSFRHPRHYPDYWLQPIRKINTRLIIEEWDNIQRIAASLAHKTTTQSTIVRKLASYRRNNRTQQALWEYDNVVKTEHILNYVHSRTLRHHVQKALNRGEGYHRLRRNIFFAHEGKFRVHSVTEQQVWNDCARLIANAIIYYNTYVLSALLAYHQRQGHQAVVEQLKRISPLAWQHINLYGRYQFMDVPVPLDLEAVIPSIDVHHLMRPEEA